MAAWLGLGAVIAAQAPSDNVENGRKLYEQFGCYTCHGRLGQGSAAGPRLGPRPVAEAALIAYVRKPSGQMPPFTEKVISDAQLSDIRAYLASVPEPAREIPLLQQ
jgi:ubiquinol-cytochrome c reductase cytochrome c subunit